MTGTTVFNVIEHHNGWIVGVTDAPVPEYTTLHLSFRNVVDQQHFSHALKTAWSGVTVIDRPGSVGLNIVVKLGS